MGNQQGTQGNRPNRVLSITVHLERGQDDDLIKTLNSVPKGHRATVVKKALRGVTSGAGAAAFAMPQQMMMPLLPDHSEALNYLTDKVAWVENALNDLPGYLDQYMDRLVQQVASARPSRSTRASPPPAPEPIPDRERASDDVLQQRDQRLKKASW